MTEEESREADRVLSSMEALSVVLQDHTSGAERWLAFKRPVEVLEAHRLEDVIATLRRVRERVSRGMYAAGFVSYEASPAMDVALHTESPGDLPLAWFGIYTAAESVRLESYPPAWHRAQHWRPSVSDHEYRQAVERIKRYIEAGETYEVNYTFRLRSPFRGDPWSHFLALEASQRSKYSAYLHLGRFHICSVSPELFFSLDGRRLSCRPMKGTIRRGACEAEDAALSDALRASEKNQAENVMIVDVIRNDMGRVAEAGTVRVTELFEVESFPTVLQMTSTVESDVSPDFVEIFRSMFPCASITGAPKARTMEIIRGLEGERRDIYTGAIGALFPDGRAQFNVAIRTVLIDAQERTATYGVGGGIVWDSVADEEYEECRAKARVLLTEFPPFEIMESILWDELAGHHLLEHHLDRLGDAARYFGFGFSREAVRAALEAHGRAEQAGQGRRRLKVRALLGRAGSIRIESAPLSAMIGARIGIAQQPIEIKNPFISHKTTNRRIHDEAIRAANSGTRAVYDVLLWNEDGYVTESCCANVVVRLDGGLVTPRLDRGLLPGVFRRALLERGTIVEGDLTTDDLYRAAQLFLVNSVRGWMALRATGRRGEWIVESEGNLETRDPDSLVTGRAHDSP